MLTDNTSDKNGALKTYHYGCFMSVACCEVVCMVVLCLWHVVKWCVHNRTC